MNPRIAATAALALASVFALPRPSSAAIPNADRKKIQAHSTDGKDDSGTAVEGVEVRNHHNDLECKSLYKARNNNKEGTEDDRASFVKNTIQLLGNDQSAFKSPNGKCECFYNQNLVIIYNSTANNRGTAYCKQSKASALAFCRDFRAGKNLAKLTAYGCAGGSGTGSSKKPTAKQATKKGASK
jgi:hypothetical protein